MRSLRKAVPVESASGRVLFMCHGCHDERFPEVGRHKVTYGLGRCGHCGKPRVIVACQCHLPAMEEAAKAKMTNEISRLSSLTPFEVSLALEGLEELGYVVLSRETYTQLRRGY